VRRDLPVWLGFIGGMVVTLETFFDVQIIKEMSNSFLQWRVVMAAIALFLGGGNMIRIHSKHIQRKKAVNSMILISSMFILFFLGVLDSRGIKSPTYKFIFDNMYTPLGATVFSMNAFYIASACYRAFRVRNGQAAVLLFSGVLVIMGTVGIGAVIWGQFPVISQWILKIPNSAAMRGMSMGAALGMVGVSLRVVLGLERGHLGAQ